MLKIKKLVVHLIIIFFFPTLCFYAEAAGTVKAMEASKIAPADENRPLTLEDCYNLALKQSELIAVNSELIRQAEAHFLEAFGTLMPQVSFSHTEMREHSSDTSFNRTYEAKFTFTQALFTGFKEFAGMASSRFEKSQRENEKWRAEQLLFVDVSDAFYLLLETQADLKTLMTIEKALTDRIKELKARENIGKSRTSEVVTTQYQLYNLQAGIESDKNQELIVRELLAFLTGRPIVKIVESKIGFDLKPESQYLAEASFRPDVEAANFAWKADQKKIIIARSGFLPQINLESDYYSHRANAPTDSKWDAMLTLNIPIFEGTTTYGQVKEAISIAKESELLYTRAGRIAIQDIHDAYVNMQSAILIKKTLAKALKSAELSYHLQNQDYKLNVVNNLDVLTAIQNLEDVRRNFIHTSYETKRFYWQLLAAAGEINVKNLKK